MYVPKNEKKKKCCKKSATQLQSSQLSNAPTRYFQATQTMNKNEKVKMMVTIMMLMKLYTDPLPDNVISRTTVKAHNPD